MVLLGHYPSERHGVEKLAEILRKQFPQLEVWASQCERDPLRWV
jgi:putative NIF3 family GTP cyclohydrolase 1 type 2